MSVPWQVRDVAICAGTAALSYGVGLLISFPFTDDPHGVGVIGAIVAMVPVMAILSRRQLRREELSRYDVFD